MEEPEVGLLVMDCSMIAAGMLPDEHDHYADQVLDIAGISPQKIIVPSLFFSELNNVLLISLRRKRISREIWLDLILLVENLRFTVDMDSSSSSAVRRIALLAVESGLSIYDATYLELALRRNAQLATLDEQLKRAAQKYTVYYH